MRKTLAFLAFLGIALQAGAADCAPNIFERMDKNGDGKVVKEEFRAAYPDMNENAFVVIDANGDGAIDQGEWNIFVAGHSQRGMPGPERGAQMNNIPGDPLIPPVDSNDLPLMRPPGM